jgi:hypothetical protein
MRFAEEQNRASIRNDGQGAQHAAKKIEECKTIGFTDLPTGTSNSGHPVAGRRLQSRAFNNDNDAELLTISLKEKYYV